MANVMVGHGNARDIHKVHALKDIGTRIKLNPKLRGNHESHWTRYVFLCADELPALADGLKPLSEVQCSDCLRIMSSRLSSIATVR